MSRYAEPEVFLIGRPQFDWPEVVRYLEAIGGTAWCDRLLPDQYDPASPGGAEVLIEFMGRLCYRSWEEGLNPNVTKVRKDSASYLRNLIDSGHGSVLEHAMFNFVFHNVSRVFTHELVRHRVGTAISQESMRYVRLDEIPFQHPAFVEEDPDLKKVADALLKFAEGFLAAATRRTGIDNDVTSFQRKKEITSAMRRYVPDGVATVIGWSANVRTLRHTIQLRTAPGAEVEMRTVFDEVARIMVKECPMLFDDLQRNEDGSWTKS